jgi:hypothetical protein
MREYKVKKRKVKIMTKKGEKIKEIPAVSQVISNKCERCGGWINPPWSRGDGDYRHCECPKKD